MAEPQLLRPVELARDAMDWTGRWRGEDVWQVLLAARDGDMATLTRLLQRDATLAQAEFWYTAPLHFAVREGHLDAVRLLLAHGADLFGRSYYAQEPLLQVAEDRERSEVAAYLRQELQRRAESDGTTHPIHAAIEAGDRAAVAKLLDNDASLANRGDSVGRRPLHYAVEAGDQDMAELLLNAGADVDAVGFSSDNRLGGYGFRPIAVALWHHPYWQQRNDYDMVSRLLAAGAGYSITVAAALGDEARVRELLRADASRANEQEPGGKRPLSAAAERNRPRIVELLLAGGADPNLPEGPNCPRGFALWAASHFGHTDIAEQLLAAGADPNADVESSGTPTGSAKDAAMRVLLQRHGGRVPLSQHFYEGNIDVIAALLEEKPALFDAERTAEGFTLGATAGHEAMLQLMLARGLRVPAELTVCQSYLWQRLELARLLLDHDMDPNLPNWQQVRPLHHMAAKGQVETARLFLAAGADAGAIDEEYRSTPLGWAARAGQAHFVRFALENGFPLAGEGTPAWAQPRAWAERRGHDEIVALLAAAG